MENGQFKPTESTINTNENPLEGGDAPPAFFERRKTRGRTTGGTLDAQTAEKLKSFFARNAEAIKEEVSLYVNATPPPSSDAAAIAAAEVEEVADKYDVFSPDVRSTRWSEFLELMNQGANSEQYDKFKKSAAGIRGNNKALTLAVTRPKQDGDDKGFSTLH